MNELPKKLLGADEPAPVMVYNADGESPFVLVADHAGNIMPRALRHLGIAEAECERHIALDIGIAGLGRLLADALDAMLIQQNYSRLVIDCNRPLDAATSISDISEHTPIPGNVGLSEGARAARAREIFWEAELDRRRQTGRPAALISLHSFTPIFEGATRPWHAGVLYNRDPGFAHLLMAPLKCIEGLVVGDNEPYSVTDALDYTIPIHGDRRGLHHVASEIRQDLIAEDNGQRAWGTLLARAIEVLRPA